MAPEKAHQRVVADRLDWVQRMADEIRSLPLGSLDEFIADRRNIGAAESCLRRALEALLDLGRHLLGKAFGVAVTEYKQIADELARAKVLTPESARQLRILAGYRNRMVHFYHTVTDQELYAICSREMGDVLAVRDTFKNWVESHPEYIDTAL
jgi:uncharacterized protein YutE (UPF0331/DUF86 family)